MKVTELRQIIAEEVKAAIRAELKDLLVEAVKVASTPVAEKSVQEIQVPKSKKTFSPLEDLLEETRLNFTAADAKTFMTQDLRKEMAQAFTGNNHVASSVASRMGLTGQEEGLDISSLPFVKNAKKVLDMSLEKDRLKGGVGHGI